MERGNSTIKKILSDVCAERKKEGKSDNWVLCLGRIMSGLNTHRGRMANAVSSYRTLFGCDYHRITSSTLQDARECKTVKDILPLIMDDGQFAQYVKTNYDIDAEPTKTADQELNEDLNYWEYDEEERIMLRANPKEFVNSYSNVNCKEAAAGRTGLNEDSEDGEEDEEEEMLLENQPLKSEEAESDLKQAASTDGELKGLMEPSTYATVTQDGPTQELNSSSKELFPKDRDVTKNNKLSPTTIVRKLMKVDEGWNDKTVIKHQVKSEWRRPLPYKCLYPRLYCEECDADCYICGYDEKYLDAHSKGKGWYDTEFINIFSRMVCHVGHSKDPSKKGQKAPNTPELLICVFPVDMASYNNEAIEVIQPKKDRLVVLFCVESHYAVCEVILKDRVMRISDGLDKPLSKWFPQAEYVLKKIGVVPQDTYVNIIGRQMGATIVMNGIPPWNLLPDDFLHQSDGHNCGPIACLKFMDLFHIMPKADIEKSKQTYRQLVTQQYSVLFEKMKFDLVIAQRTSFENIVRGIHIVCMCTGNENINSKEWRIMKCCGHLFHFQCILDITNTSGLCMACGHKVPPTKVDLPRYNDSVREDSVKKRKRGQIHQGEKMKKAYADSLKQSAMKVTVASVVTVFVDRRVASHARGVLAIVVEKKDTGAVIACSEAGIITNGQGKKIWWIPSDGYKLISSAAEITALSPYLLQVQQEINEGTFDQKTQAKVTLAVAHQHSIGASSPCKKSCCSCIGGRCGARCGCKRAKKRCSSTCTCSGNCDNPLNTHQT